MQTVIFRFLKEETTVFFQPAPADAKKEYTEGWSTDRTFVAVLTDKTEKQIEATLKKVGLKEQQQTREGWREFKTRSTDKGVVYLFRPSYRPIYEIAREINNVWSNVYFGARPYLNAMFSLTSITDEYGYDEATEILQYFLANATSFRGAEARRIKAELMQLVASHPEK